jgi:RNA polymerase sigma factor (sigma-70 family)
MQNKEESNSMWRRFLDGDNAAYEWLYTEHVQDLYRYGLRFGAGSEVVKDCIQEVFAGLYGNRARHGVPDNVATYLMVSLKHSIMRNLQRRERIREVEAGGVSEFLLEPTVEEAFIDSEREAGLKETIERIFTLLTPRQKEALYYRYIRELEIVDICRLMELNYQSVQNLIQRSLKKIRENYKK